MTATQLIAPHQLVDRLATRVPGPVLELCQRLAERGHRAWIVGGCVRDELLAAMRGDVAEGARGDWDIATSARPEQVQAAFKRVIPTGLQHGTVTVLLGRDSFEVTTLRGEGAYTDGRHPDQVRYVDDIESDLARRDFTVNAIAYHPQTRAIIDPFDGMGDLRRGLLRAVGVPQERFAEDGLRALRAARFVAALGLQLDPATASALRPALDTYRKVSPERVRDEWLKTMKAARPSAAFELMLEHGMLEVSAPELLESVGCEQNRYHHFDVWGHAMACLDACPPAPVLRVAALLHDMGKPRTRDRSPKTGDYTFYDHERVGADMALTLLRRLRFSGDEQGKISALIRHHLICYDASWTDAAVRRFVQRVTPELLEELLTLNRADVLGKGKDASDELRTNDELRARIAAVMSQGAALTTKQLAVSGHDLMRALKLPPGPAVGQLLRSLLELVLDDPTLNQPDALLERALALQADQRSTAPS